MSEELKPCPFCGEELQINNARLAVHSRGSDCLLRQQPVVVDDPAQVGRWNTRNQLASTGGEAVEVIRVPDSVFKDEFQVWWEDHGQFCRAGGGDYERTFAFQAWRHMFPMLLQARSIAAAASGATNEILGLILAECRYWHGRDEARRGNFAILYAAAKELAEKKGAAGVVVPNEHLMALLEHCETIERAGESFTEIKPETLRALCSALLNQAGGE